jgi:hypothetical protein
MTTSLYVSVKPEEFVGVENEVGEGLAHVGSARAYVTGSIGRGGRVSDRVDRVDRILRNRDAFLDSG